MGAGSGEPGHTGLQGCGRGAGQGCRAASQQGPSRRDPATQPLPAPRPKPSRAPLTGPQRWVAPDSARGQLGTDCGPASPRPLPAGAGSDRFEPAQVRAPPGPPTPQLVVMATSTWRFRAAEVAPCGGRVGGGFGLSGQGAPGTLGRAPGSPGAPRPGPSRSQAPPSGPEQGCRLHPGAARTASSAPRRPLPGVKGSTGLGDAGATWRHRRVPGPQGLQGASHPAAGFPPHPPASPPRVPAGLTAGGWPAWGGPGSKKTHPAGGSLWKRF